MRRWGWIFALLVSVGLNVGILATLWVTRGQATQPPGEGRPPSNTTEEPSRPAPPIVPDPPSGSTRPVPSNPPPKLRELAERLGLSGEQRERFFALQLRMIATMRDGRGQIQRLRREVRAEMLSARPDRDRIEERLAAIETAQIAMERQTVRTILDTRELLDGAAERQYMTFITRLRLGAGDSRSDDGRERSATPILEERLERRRRIEEWRGRQRGQGRLTPPLRSDSEATSPPQLEPR